jgi:hypothetical protein
MKVSMILIPQFRPFDEIKVKLRAGYPYKYAEKSRNSSFLVASLYLTPVHRFNKTKKANIMSYTNTVLRVIWPRP